MVSYRIACTLKNVFAADMLRTSRLSPGMGGFLLPNGYQLKATLRIM
jgi:hypothetical protein